MEDSQMTSFGDWSHIVKVAPIDKRLQAVASSSNGAPICAYCSPPDGRKGTIRCNQCQVFVHSVSCAGFANHREANHSLHMSNLHEPVNSSSSCLHSDSHRPSRRHSRRPNRRHSRRPSRRPSRRWPTGVLGRISSGRKFYLTNIANIPTSGNAPTPTSFSRLTRPCSPRL